MSLIITITKGNWFRYSQGKQEEKINLPHVKKAIRFVNPTTIELKAPSVVIGRSSNCEIISDDPAVSGQHCRIYLETKTEFKKGVWRKGKEPTPYYIEDIGSKNGTKINRNEKLISVPLDQPQQLNKQDQIIIGDTILTVTQ